MHSFHYFEFKKSLRFLRFGSGGRAGTSARVRLPSLSVSRGRRDAVVKRAPVPPVGRFVLIYDVGSRPGRRHDRFGFYPLKNTPRPDGLANRIDGRERARTTNASGETTAGRGDGSRSRGSSPRDKRAETSRFARRQPHAAACRPAGARSDCAKGELSGIR